MGPGAARGRGSSVARLARIRVLPLVEVGQALVEVPALMKILHGWQGGCVHEAHFAPKGDNHHILNFGRFVSAKTCNEVVGSGLALLGIVVAIGIVAEQCEGLTIPTVDHFSPINAG